MAQSKVICIFGAGFIGTQLIRRLCSQNHRIVIVTRSPFKKGYLKLAGNAGQVDLERVHLFDEEKLKTILNSCDIIINLVGCLFENKTQRFENLHHLFPKLLVKISNEANIEKLIHISALCNSEEVNSKYMKSKRNGEYELKKFSKSVILRPSVVFGPGSKDEFFCRFASLAEWLPALPIIGQNKFQPLYVSDLCQAIVAILEKEEISENIYELGGPEILDFRELMIILLRQIKKKRLLLPINLKLAKYLGKVIQLFPKPLLTEDQVELLKHDSVVSNNYPTLRDLGINPRTIESVLPNYIWRFRRGGEFSKLK